MQQTKTVLARTEGRGVVLTGKPGPQAAEIEEG